MFLYYTINAIDVNCIHGYHKIKNKLSNGYFYKLMYEKNNLSLNTIILKVDLSQRADYINLVCFEKDLLKALNMNTLNPTPNIEHFLKKNNNENGIIFIKLCGMYTNNYNYGIIYKLVNSS
jgi:hypothetical protein